MPLAAACSTAGRRRCWSATARWAPCCTRPAPPWTARCPSSTCPTPAWSHDPRELPERRRGHHPGQHVRRQPAVARRPRLPRQGGRDQPGRGADRPRGPGPVRPRRAGGRVGVARRHRPPAPPGRIGRTRRGHPRADPRPAGRTGRGPAHPGDLRLPRRAGRGGRRGRRPDRRAGHRPGHLRRRRAHPGRRDPARGRHSCCPPCRWPCSAPTAPSARSGCSPWRRTWSGTPRCRSARSPTPASRGAPGRAASSSASTAATSPATSAASPRPGCPWSAAAAAPPPPTSGPPPARSGPRPETGVKTPRTRSSRNRYFRNRKVRIRTIRNRSGPRRPVRRAAGRPAGRAAGSSSRPRSPPAGGPTRRWRPWRCCRPRAPGCSRSSRRRAPAPAPTPWTWPCTCSRPGVETIAALTTWDKTIMTLQADLLGAHALGLRNVICTTGSPPVLGDYPAVDGIWEVDSLGLIALLAGLNAGRDSNGLATATQTSFCVGARVDPGARDPEAELARARAKVRAGRALPGQQAGLRARRAAPDGGRAGRREHPAAALGHPAAQLRGGRLPGQRGPRGERPAGRAADHGAGRAAAARAAGLDLAAALVREARDLVSGVIVTAAEDDPAGLAPLLAATRTYYRTSSVPAPLTASAGRCSRCRSRSSRSGPGPA